MTALTPERRTIAIDRALLAGSLLLALALHAPHLANRFVWDDHSLLEANPAVTGAAPWRDVLFRDEWYATGSAMGSRLPYYRPAVVAVMRLLWAAGAGAPWSFHVASLVLHLLNGVLAASVLAGLGVPRRAAVAVAAVFLVHPLSGEAVYWAANVCEPLALACVLGALASFASAVDPATRRPAAAKALLAACAALAIFSKETGFVVLALVPAAALSAPREEWAARLRSAWPAWVPVPLYLVLRSQLPEHSGGDLALGEVGSGLSRAAQVLAWDARRLVWPFPLSPIHSLPPLTTAHLAVAFTLVAAGTGVVVWVARRRPRNLFWAAWVVAPLLPPMTQLFLSRTTAFVVAERYLFLSLVPALAAIAMLLLGAARRLGPSRSLWALGGVVALALAVSITATERYGRSFDGDDRYFSHVIALYPEEPVTLLALGAADLSRGDAAAALARFDAAARAEPRLPQAHLRRGVALASLGRVEEAIAAYQAGLRLDDRIAAGHLALARLLRDAGRAPEAGPHLAAAVRVAPDDAGARTAYGTWLYGRGDLGGALEQWDAGLALRPESCELLFDVGAVRSALAYGAARAPLERFLSSCGIGFEPQRAEAERLLAR